ncbi:unnamed protein product, partial [Notodromas monacha]
MDGPVERFYLEPDPTKGKKFRVLLNPTELEERQAKDFLDRMEIKQNRICYKEADAQFTYWSNITDESEAKAAKITELTAKSRDYELLEHIWVTWRNATGRKMRQLYTNYMTSENDTAKKKGFANAADMWTDSYNVSTFHSDIDKVWQELAPLYKKLHAFVRLKLVDVYGDKIDKKGPIPAHITGNPWAQAWNYLEDIVQPFKGLPSIDVTESLNNQGYTVVKMFKTAEEFFTSLDLMPMTKTFWKKSVLVRPPGVEMACHASAWDMCSAGDDEDFRIKMCTQKNHADFLTAHHEMGHIQYFMQYRHHPRQFRDGANPGFHEAIGDTLALSVATTKHLKRVGLLTPTQKRLHLFKENELDLNYLMKVALDKIAFLPFGYIVDKWRWDLFKGIASLDKMNAHWWKLREEIQGLKAPVPRTEEDLDPGAKNHVATGSKYVAYFVSFIIQFQFYEALCKISKEYEPNNPEKPLHRCDFYQNLDAGDVFREGMRQGSSLPWPDVMQIITGQRSMTAKPLRTYFLPLEKYLEKELAAAEECIGWGSLLFFFGAFYSVCGGPKTQLQHPAETGPKNLLEFQGQVEKANVKGLIPIIMSNASVWVIVKIAVLFINYSNRMNAAISNSVDGSIERFYLEPDPTQLKSFRVILSPTEIEQGQAKDFLDRMEVKHNHVCHLASAAQFEYESNITEESEAKALRGAADEMSKIYSTATICLPDGKCGLHLDPEITELTAKSRDYELLKHIWVAWRDATGRKMRQLYTNYMTSENDTAKNEGFANAADMWTDSYNVSTFHSDIDKVWQELAPLYKKLHAFVRLKLFDVYGDKIDKKGPIPAHITGNPWAQAWNYLEDIVQPFKGLPHIDVTESLNNQGYTVLKMFRTAEEFFTSIGLMPMTSTFWNKSVLVRPPGVEMICHASAWDMCSAEKDDFRFVSSEAKQVFIASMK